MRLRIRLGNYRGENYSEDYRIKRKIAFIVFLILFVVSLLIKGYLGYLSIPIFLVLFYFLFKTIKISNSYVGENLNNDSPRNEPMRAEYKIPVNKQSQTFCPQCGGLIDKYIQNQSVDFCSDCGYEIKNTN